MKYPVSSNNIETGVIDATMELGKNTGHIKY